MSNKLKHERTFKANNKIIQERFICSVLITVVVKENEKCGENSAGS
jgi:hypothetical protein